MDRKRYEIKICIILVLIISIFIIFKKSSKHVIKTCCIKGDELIIVFDISNKSKIPGKLREITIFNTQEITEDNYKIEGDEKILKVNCSSYKENFHNNFTYEIGIDWFGGFLKAYAVYDNGNFIIKKETCDLHV